MADRGRAVDVVANIIDGLFAHEGGIDKEVLARSPERRLHEARGKAAGEIVELDITVILDQWPVIVNEKADIGIKAQPFGSAEEIPMRPIGMDARAVDSRIARRHAEEARLALGHLDEDRDVAVGVERFGLADAHRTQRLDAPDGFARIGDLPGRVALALFEMDEGAHDRRIDILGAGYGHRADPRLGAWIDNEDEIHLAALMEDGRLRLSDFGVRPRLRA